MATIWTFFSTTVFGLTIFAGVFGAMGGFVNTILINNRSLLPQPNAKDEDKEEQLSAGEGAQQGATTPAATAATIAARQEAIRVAKPKKRLDYVKQFGFYMVVGAVASALSWLTYGPYSAAAILGKTVIEGTGAPPLPIGMTAMQVATAFIIGLGGTKWLQSERDKGNWQAAADAAASSPPSPELARLLRSSSSGQAQAIAQAAAEAAREKQASP